MKPDDETVRVMGGWGLRRSLNPTRGEYYGWSGMARLQGRYQFVSVLPVQDPESEYDDDIAYCASYPISAYRIGADQRVKAYAPDPVAAMSLLVMGVQD